jgi:hypothetical protein
LHPFEQMVWRKSVRWMIYSIAWVRRSGLSRWRRSYKWNNVDQPWWCVTVSLSINALVFFEV